MKARLYEGKADHSPYDHWLQLHSHGSCTVYRSHDLLAACTVISPEFFLFSPLRAASSHPAIAIVTKCGLRLKYSGSWSFLKMLHKILCTWLRTSTRRRTAEEFRDTMSGSEMEVEVVMGTTTPPRNNLTQRIYSLQPPSPQPHDGCGLDITWPLLDDAFKPPSTKKEKLISGWPPQNPHPSSPSVLRPPPNHLQSSPSVLTPVHLSVGLQQHQHLHQ